MEATKSPLVPKSEEVGCFFITGAVNSHAVEVSGAVSDCLRDGCFADEIFGVAGASMAKLKLGVVAEAHFLDSSSSNS